MLKKINTLFKSIAGLGLISILESCGPTIIVTFDADGFLYRCQEDINYPQETPCHDFFQRYDVKDIPQLSKDIPENYKLYKRHKRNEFRWDGKEWDRHKEEYEKNKIDRDREHHRDHDRYPGEAPHC